MSTKQHEGRTKKAKACLESAFRSAEPTKPPIIAWPLHYILFGTEAADIPADLFTSPARMLEYQTRLCDRQLTEVQDDFVPYLVPYMGTCVLASAFGLPVDFHPGRDPSPGRPCVQTPEDVARLRLPDPNRDGLMPRVLEVAAHMRDHGVYPVGLTDSQSPLDELILLCGHETLYAWMYEEPKLVHDLFALATEAFINWVKAQKAVTGEGLQECRGEQGVWIPGPCGVWLADDEAVNLSPELYEEFIVPHYSRIFREFGGGVLHFCGRGYHLGDAILKMDGLRAVNSGPMGDPENTAKLQQALEGKIPLIYQEFSPIHAEEYYRKLLSMVSLKGLILAPIVTDTVATDGPAFMDVKRDRIQEAKRIHRILRELTEKQLQQEVE